MFIRRSSSTLLHRVKKLTPNKHHGLIHNSKHSTSTLAASSSTTLNDNHHRIHSIKELEWVKALLAMTAVCVSTTTLLGGNFNSDKTDCCGIAAVIGNENSDARWGYNISIITLQVKGFLSFYICSYFSYYWTIRICLFWINYDGT